MREVIEKNAYEIAKFTAVGCAVIGCLLLVTAMNRTDVEHTAQAIAALRMWGFAAAAWAIAIFIDGRRQLRRR